ncbi:restriction endonuclease subunit S, partial [Lachnospiraceae bacterium YH-ros2228]
RDEQQKCMDMMDLLESIIRERKSQLDKLDELIRARFVELFGSISNNKFGYEVMTLQDVCEPIKDGTHQTPTYTEDAVNGYKFLSSKDVTSGKVDWNHLKYIPEELHKELYKRISPRKGDILLAKNGTTGVAAIVDRDDVFDIYVSLALLRPLGMVTSEYLCSAVNSIETKHQFDSSLKGIGVPNLHLGEIKKTKIVVPPIEEQEKFAEFVKQVDKSKVAVQKALDEAQLLFDSLMQEYFG